MTTFYICRHGQTENNKNKRLSGWIDTPLTADGIKNAATSAEKLRSIKFDKIISSDLGRAFITAYLISRKLGYTSTIELSKELREVNYGDLANLPYSGAESVYPELSATENTNYIPPQGESLAQMQQRVMACIKVISQANPDKTILLSCHDGTINAVFASFTGRDIGTVDADSANHHDFVAKFVYDNGKVISFESVTA
ncbi:MAG TPA: histidine phosphatase family protein [Patescibacteria group bacterium]|jgi:broad specificity phosphatase PhoE|nr:histidine phosphatase family protein [Patescibacteria group bacterium]